MRVLWEQYLPDAHAVVWVVDAPRWVNNHELSEEHGATYRRAVYATLMPIVRTASARSQPIVVVVSQLDALVNMPKPDGPGEITELSVVQHVESSLNNEWTRLTDDTSLDGTLTPRWVFVGASAATGDGISHVLDAVYDAVHT